MLPQVLESIKAMNVKQFEAVFSESYDKLYGELSMRQQGCLAEKSRIESSMTDLPA